MPGIGDLVASLAIDNRKFIAGAKQAESVTALMSSKITGLLTPLAASFAGAFAIGSAISGAKEAVAAEAKLNAVLAATGNAAGVTTEEIKKYASQLQAVTNFEDDATVAAAAMLASLGNIRGDNFKAAIAVAQDMATVMEVDLVAAVKKISKELKGLPVDEVNAKISALQGRFGGAAKSVADPFVKLKNNVGDIGETLGTGMLPVLNALAETSVGWLVPMNDLLGSGVNAITKMTEVVIGAGVAFVALKAATIAYAAYQRLATISAVTFQAVVNPALMFKVAAGIAIAAGTVLAMDAAMGKVAGAAPGVAAGLGNIADAADGMAVAVGKAVDPLEAIKSQVRDTLDFLANAGDERKAMLDKLLRDAGGVTTPGVFKEIRLLEGLLQRKDELVEKLKEQKDAEEAAAKAQKDAADKILEHKERAAELNDELAVLAGTMTKQEAAARALERQGFTPDQAKDLAGKQAQLDAANQTGKPSGRTEVAAAFKGSQEAASILLRGVGGKSMEQIAQKQLTTQQQTLVAIKGITIPPLIPLTLGT